MQIHFRNLYNNLRLVLTLAGGTINILRLLVIYETFHLSLVLCLCTPPPHTHTPNTHLFTPTHTPSPSSIYESSLHVRINLYKVTLAALCDVHVRFAVYTKHIVIILIPCRIPEYKLFANFKVLYTHLL